MLGTSPDVPLNLVEAGLLEAVRNLTADDDYAWKLSYQSITAFIARLRNSVTAYPARQLVQPIDLVVDTAQMLPTYGFINCHRSQVGAGWGTARLLAQRRR